MFAMDRCIPHSVSENSIEDANAYKQYCSCVIRRGIHSKAASLVIIIFNSFKSEKYIRAPIIAHNYMYLLLYYIHLYFQVLWQWVLNLPEPHI